MLGWSPGKNKEVIEIDEIIKLFDIKKISKSSSIFSYDKLNFLNNHFIKNDNDFSQLYKYCNENPKLNKLLTLDKEMFLRLFIIYKNKIFSYENLEEIVDDYFIDNFRANKNNLFDKNFNQMIQDFLFTIEKIFDWNLENLEKEITIFIKEKKVQFSLFGKPARQILINNKNGPSIGDILFILGKKSSIQRIKNYISTI